MCSKRCKGCKHYTCYLWLGSDYSRQVDSCKLYHTPSDPYCKDYTPIDDGDSV